MKQDTAELERQYMQLVEGLLSCALYGVPAIRLKSAAALANEYKQSPKFSDSHHRVRELIKWETSKNFSSGFITGLGGLVTLPAAIPAALSASWMIQARLAAAIAHIYEHDLSEQRIQTLTLLCMIGDSGKELAKKTGIQLGTDFTEQALAKVSAEALLQINKQVGFKLLARAGESGAINLAYVVPVAGGIVSGTIDAVACRAVGAMAQRVFGNVDMCSDIVDVDVIADT
jgi:uncharacterized protein (DUF697 family)